MSKLGKLKVVGAADDQPSDASPIQAAEAALDSAQRGVSVAATEVQRVLANWPGGIRDRRWADDMVLGSVFTKGAHDDPTTIGKRAVPQRAEYAAAVEAERRAIAERDGAQRRLDHLRREHALATCRANLRAAVQAVATHHAAAERAQAAVERAQGLVTVARDRQEHAETQLAKAKAARAERMQAVALSGGDLEPDQTVRAARLALEDADDVLEMAKAALVKVEAEAEEPVAALSKARERVEKAARLVMVADLPRLRAEVLKAGREHFRRAAAMRFVVDLIDFHDFDHQQRQAYAWFADRHMYTADLADSATLQMDTQKPWAAALQALMTDPDAPLPAEA